MKRLAAVLTVALLLASCNTDEKRGSSYKVPEKSEKTAATEARIAPLIEQSQRGSRAPGQCTVRFLGEKDETTFVWASCRWLPAGGSGGPFAVKGDQVTGTKDGSEYDDSVRQLFPYDLAEAILYDAERLAPEEDPIG